MTVYIHIFPCVYYIYTYLCYVHLYSMHLAIMSISAYGIRIAMVSISGTWQLCTI